MEGKTGASDWTCSGKLKACSLYLDSVILEKGGGCGGCYLHSEMTRRNSSNVYDVRVGPMACLSSSSKNLPFLMSRPRGFKRFNAPAHSSRHARFLIQVMPPTQCHMFLPYSKHMAISTLFP